VGYEPIIKQEAAPSGRWSRSILRIWKRLERENSIGLKAGRRPFVCDELKRGAIVMRERLSRAQIELHGHDVQLMAAKLRPPVLP
jgi:hypothetical protein